MPGDHNTLSFLFEQSDASFQPILKFKEQIKSYVNQIYYAI